MPILSPSAIDPSGLAFQYDDWQERVALWKPGGEDVFSVESSQATLTGIIPWDVRASFVRSVLPYAYVNGFSLVREPALVHPWYDFLTAYSVTLKPFGPTTKDFFDGAGKVIKFPAGNPELQFDTTMYQKCEATISFKQQPYIYFEDDLIDNKNYSEADRYTWDVSREGTLDTLSMEGITMKFAEGPAGIAGTTLPGIQSLKKFQETISLKWMFVPAEYIFGTPVGAQSLNPAQINRCIGKVNADTFLGYPPGTLLFQPPTYERFSWPDRSSGGPGSSLYGFHITFSFAHFDPTKGVPASPYRGFNLFPSRNTDATFGKWYYATGGASAGDPVLGTPFIESEYFGYAFLANGDPTVLPL